MSRTDKTRPEWVKERDPFMRHHFYEKHDHRHGECDLPVVLANPKLYYWQTSCHLQLKGNRQTCCCRLCTGYWWRKRLRRRMRHTGRALTRALLKDPHLADETPLQLIINEAW